MNQPKQLNIACDFQGFLVCQMPKDIVEIELKIKTKWEKVDPSSRSSYQEREVQALEQSKVQNKNTLEEKTAPP